MKYTRVIEGNDVTHEFRIGDIVRVLFTVARDTQENEKGDVVRTYVKGNWGGELPQ